MLYYIFASKTSNFSTCFGIYSIFRFFCEFFEN